MPIITPSELSVLRQGVTDIEDVRMLGTSIESIQEMFKHFNSLSDARGSMNFGVVHYTRIHALMEYVCDQQHCHNQVPDAAGFTDTVISHISVNLRSLTAMVTHCMLWNHPN